MSDGQQQQQVVLKFNVDSSGAVVGIKQLTAATGEFESKTKAAAKSADEGWGGINSAVERSKRLYGEMAGAVGALTDLIKGFAEKERLALGSAKADMEQLAAASRGLRSQTDLMRDASKLLGGEFKITSKEVAIFEEAMFSLTHKGKEQGKVYEALSQSMLKLSTEGLQELGIRVKKAGLDMEDTKDRTELYLRIMKALKEEAKGVAGAELTKGEAAAQSGVAFTNAVDKIKTSLGEMAVALTPIVEKADWMIRSLPTLAKGIGTMLGRIGEWALKNGFAGPGAQKLYNGANKSPADWGDLYTDWAVRGGEQARKSTAMGKYHAGDINAPLQAGITSIYSYLPFDTNSDYFKETFGVKPGPVGDKYKGKADRDAAAAKWQEYLQWVRENTKKETDELVLKIEKEMELEVEQGLRSIFDATRHVADEVKIKSPVRGDRKSTQFKDYIDQDLATLKGGVTLALSKIATESMGLPGGTSIGSSKIDAGYLSTIKVDLKEIAAIAKGFKDLEPELKHRSTQTLLEKMFGPIEEFKLYEFGLKQLGTALTAFSGAAGAAFGAWIDGSMSAGAAFKKFIGEALKAQAVSLMAEAVKQGVLALVSLASRDFIGAASHGKAAAAALAGAAVIGGLAKAVGGGHVSTPGGPSAGGTAAPPPRNDRDRDSERGHHRVIVIGDPHGDRSPRERTKDFRRQANRALGTGWSYEG